MYWLDASDPEASVIKGSKEFSNIQRIHSGAWKVWRLTHDEGDPFFVVLGGGSVIVTGEYHCIFLAEDFGFADKSLMDIAELCPPEITVFQYSPLKARKDISKMLDEWAANSGLNPELFHRAKIEASYVDFDSEHRMIQFLSSYGLEDGWPGPGKIFHYSFLWAVACILALRTSTPTDALLSI